jgi:ovo-like protein
MAYESPVNVTAGPINGRRVSFDPQEQPIDYAVPKRKEEPEESSERGREGAKATRTAIGNSIARPLLAMRLSGSQGIHVAASGHGRSSGASGGGGGAGGGAGGGGGGGGGGGQSGNSGSSSGGGGGGGSGGASSGGGYVSGGGGGGGGTAAGGGTGGAGGGGMNPGGNGGRGNYGPSSPPTGSLPPFYESLKGGNNLANFASQYNGKKGFFLPFVFFFATKQFSSLAPARTIYPTRGTSMLFIFYTPVCTCVYR